VHPEVVGGFQAEGNLAVGRAMSIRSSCAALRAGAASVGKVELGRRAAQVKLAGGTWSQSLSFIELTGVRYLDEGKDKWTAAIPNPMLNKDKLTDLTQPKGYKR
jgi:hypothetical protein